MATMDLSMSVLEQQFAAILDRDKKTGRYRPMYPPTEMAGRIDFGSNDTLALSSSGPLRREFLAEFNRYGSVDIAAKGSRILDGNNQYVVDLEAFLARFHNAPAALTFATGFIANVAVFTVLPQPGDVIIHDEYMHASAVDGFRSSRAAGVKIFKHNDLASFRETITQVLKTYPDIAHGKQSVFVAVESTYSMDGDSPPVHAMLSITKKLLRHRNAVYFVDEAHTNGLLGPRGSGFVCHHGLEKEIAIRAHCSWKFIVYRALLIVAAFGKALASCGAVVLCSPIIKDMLENYARSFIYSIPPAFPALALVKAGYSLVASAEGDQRRQTLQRNIGYFLQYLLQHKSWIAAHEAGVLRLADKDRSVTAEYQSPITPIVTKVGKARALRAWINQHGFYVWALTWPVVPRSEERIRLMIHADHSKEQLRRLVDCMLQWADMQRKGQAPEATSKL